MVNPRRRFSLGRTVITPAALSALEGSGEDAVTYLTRHHSGDWGEGLSLSDQRSNEQALINGGRLFSSYRLSDGTKLWVITDAEDDEGHRASTCVMLPSDY